MWMTGFAKYYGVLLLGVSFAIGNPAVAQSQEANSTTVFRDKVRLVSVDVIALDRDGEPARDLTADDFVVTENGAAQRVLSVEGHFGSSATGKDSSGKTALAMDKAGAVQLSNRPKGGIDVWNVILLDGLNSSVGDQAQARKELHQFIKTLPADEPVALATMDPLLRLLVSFNAGAGGVDKLLATAAAGPKASPLVTVYNEDDQALLDQVEKKMPGHGAALENAKAAGEAGQLDRRVRMVASNFDALAGWLSQYPGKKNVFWLSTGFPLMGEPSSHWASRSKAAEERGRDFRARQEDLARNLQLARIAIFPIDIRGVLGDFPGMQDATHNGSRYIGSPGALALASDMDSFSANQREEIMQEMNVARSTGGVVKFNSNDIGGMLGSAYRDGQSFYTLTYSPVDKNWNGNYRSIEMKLQRKGYRLEYRRGYYAVEQPSGALTPDAFTMSLRRSAPPVRGVLFTATLKKTAEGVVVDYSVDPRTLQFSAEGEGGEERSAQVDCAVVAYDAAGKVVGTNEIRVQGKVKPGQWAHLQEAGFPAHQVMPMRADYAFLTIGVRDRASGAFGNMEVALGR